MNAHTKQQQDEVFEMDFIDSQKSDPPFVHLLALIHIYGGGGGTKSYIYVCVFVYTSVHLTHVGACICAYMHVCMSLPLHLCVHVSVCACVGACMQTKCLWVYLDIWQCMKYVCACIFVFKCLSSISFAQSSFCFKM